MPYADGANFMHVSGNKIEMADRRFTLTTMNKGDIKMKKEDLGTNANGKYMSFDLVNEAISLDIDGGLITHLVDSEKGIEALCLITEQLKTIAALQS